MKLNELVEKHEFHDSYFESIDKKDSSLTIKLMFCYWQQEGYDDADDDQGIVTLEFSNLSFYECSAPDPTDDNIDIISAAYVDDCLIFSLSYDTEEESLFYEMKIKAKDVQFSK